MSLLARVKVFPNLKENFWIELDHQKGLLLTFTILKELRVEFSDLRNHRYRHNFHCPSPICLCQTGIEENEHFLLHCPRFSSQRRVLLDLVLKSVNFATMRLSSKELCNLLLYGHSKCTITTNRVIIESTLEYIKGTGLF